LNSVTVFTNYFVNPGIQMLLNRSKHNDVAESRARFKMNEKVGPLLEEVFNILNINHVVSSIITLSGHEEIHVIYSSPTLCREWLVARGCVTIIIAM
jgi:hypothetical protein